MDLNEMEIPCDPILDKAKRDELVQNTELLKQVTIKPIPVASWTRLYYYRTGSTIL